MNRYKELLSETLFIGVGNFTTKLIYFFLMPLYTTALTAGEVGQADLLNNLEALLLPVFTLSIAEGVSRFVLDNKENSNVRLTLYTNMMRPLPQWNIYPWNASFFKDTILLGVGAGINSKSINVYTKYLYKKVLNKNYIHSTRDEYTKKNVRGFRL